MWVALEIHVSSFLKTMISLTLINSFLFPLGGSKMRLVTKKKEIEMGEIDSNVYAEGDLRLDYELILRGSLNCYPQKKKVCVGVCGCV